MKSILIALSVIIFISCNNPFEKVAYIKQTDAKQDTTVVENIDFNLEKDIWVNNLLNNEKFVRKVSRNGILDYYSLSYRNMYFSGYLYVGDNTFNLYGKDSAGIMFLFQRNCLSESNRVSDITEKRIKSLLLTGKDNVQLNNKKKAL